MEEKKMKYILSLSFGKDSMAMLIEIIKRKLPLDYVIYNEIMFDKKTSGEHPLMAKWIPQAEKILKEKFNIKVIHLKSKKTFIEQFYTRKQKGKYIKQIYGFPYIKGSWCNSIIKMQPINNFIKKIKKTNNITQYIGIASDEPKRLERYKKMETENEKFITLADLKINEINAMQICKDNELLSPKYDKSFRSGCWFCNKQSLYDLYLLWKNYPHYFEKLKEMEKNSHNNFRTDNITLQERAKQFLSGNIPKKINITKKEQISIFDL